MFVQYNDSVVNIDVIDRIDYSEFSEHGHITVLYKNSLALEQVRGTEAISLLMELAPVALEGTSIKYKKNAWFIHNIIGHPLMAICTFIGLTELGNRIHDWTIPKPIL